MDGRGKSLDSGLASLLLLARYHGVPVDPEYLRHQFGVPGAVLDSIGLLRAARHLGLKARRIRSRWARLRGVPLPAIAVQKDGSYLTLAQANEGKVLVQDLRQGRPTVLQRASFEEAWSGDLILIARRGAQPPGARPFGFSWFLPAIVKYRRLLGEVLIASFFLQVFGLLSPVFTQVVIDKVLVHKGLTTLEVLGIGMLALTVFEVILRSLRTYLFSHTTSRIDVELGTQLFRHMLRLPLAYFEARRVGNTVARVRELETIRQFLTGSTVTLLLDVLFTVVFLVVMYIYSPILTYIVMGTLPLYAMLSGAVTPVFRARLNDRFNRGAENHAFLVESVSGIQTVKAMAVEPQMQRRWEEQLAGYVRASFRAVALGNVAGQAAAFINKGTTIAIVWVGAYLVIDGRLTVGELIAFTMLAGRVTDPVLRVVQLWQDFQQAGVSVARLGDLLNAPAEPSSRPSQAALPELTGHVAFEQVSFRYRPDGPEVLRELTFEIPAGQVIGLVGRSGSGKSTIAKLIQRLYIPERGRILVDGIDVAQIDPVWLRRQIGVVLQENFLFDLSVRENIALADPGMPMEAVVQAAQLAGAHEFILALPEGYDTRVGEHGVTLSGGQRQRIAIARALVMNPRILIFDEATSALDYESEHIVQRNLARICAGRTVFIIAHRLSTVRPADRIFVVDRGTIIEQGTYGELLAQDGYFTRLHRYQEWPVGVTATNAPGVTAGNGDHAATERADQIMLAVDAAGVPVGEP